MEYVQMTLTDWMEVKHRLKMELQGIKQSFVRIGYVLRKIEDQKLYEQDGYKSVAEFAKAEYGLEASTVSRFMSINREYSIDGYSEHLREEYLDMGRSQLEEMLKLTEADREMIQPETQRADIRALKAFNKAEPVAGVADNIRELIEKFFEENRDILNELFEKDVDVKAAVGIINPSGNKSYKKGMVFMMMYENRVVFKQFGTNPQNMEWEEFLNITKNIFEDHGKRTWEAHFGVPEPVAVEPVETVVENVDNIEENGAKMGIAPAQKIEENQGFSEVLEEENGIYDEPDDDGRGENQGAVRRDKEVREEPESAEVVAEVVETQKEYEESSQEEEQPVAEPKKKYEKPKVLTVEEVEELREEEKTDSDKEEDKKDEFRKLELKLVAKLTKMKDAIQSTKAGQASLRTLEEVREDLTMVNNILNKWIEMKEEGRCTM